MWGRRRKQMAEEIVSCMIDKEICILTGDGLTQTVQDVGQWEALSSVPSTLKTKQNKNNQNKQIKKNTRKEEQTKDQNREMADDCLQQCSVITK